MASGQRGGPAAMTRRPRERKKAAARAVSAGPTAVTQSIVVRDMTLSCAIGITKDERARPQRIRINLEAEVLPARPADDTIGEVVHYGHLVQKLRAVCAETRSNLLESLAGELAQACFFDERVKAVRLRIEKLDRYADVGGIGIEMAYERDRG